ncbi:MAG TPA: hypothetical protein VJ885_00915 [Thermoanaerobaculia bacterium]|nr:hypothetical protein [Thermoanaerobaculia bacterium]
MSRILSVPEIIASLEKQVAAHREQEARHAEREAFHREQRETHASELEALTRRLDEFRAAAAAAMDLALRDPAPAPGPPVEEEDYGPASRPNLRKMVWRVLTDLGPDRSIGAGWIAGEINRRFGHRLRKQVAVAQISAVLRRLERRGKVQLRRPGKPYHEARYAL